MLNRIAEHARIVNANPSDDFITQRSSAIRDLVQKDADLVVLLAFVELALFGLPSVRTENHNKAAETLYEVIHAHQPSFINDAEATLMDLRLVASITLGEIIQSAPPSPQSLYLAALLRSGTTLISLPPEIHLEKLLTHLLDISDEALSLGAEQLRVRQNLTPTIIKGSDVPTLGKSATTALQELVAALENNIRADREELDVLWWAFGRRSTLTGKQFESLPEGERAMTVATELSERMLMPPIKAASYVLASLVPDGPDLPLSSFVGQLSKEALLAFVGKRDGNSSESNPLLLPMTWLSERLIASDLSAGWEDEFGKKSCLGANSQFSAAKWATQLFDELVARKLGSDALVQEEEEEEEEEEDGE